MIAVSEIEKNLRQVPDFPKPGINFLDMSPVLADKNLFASLIEHMSAPFKNQKIDKIIAIESRGFILGAAMARDLGSGLVMVRKKGKLPGPTVSVSYALEYGTDQLEMLPQNITQGERVLIIDDVLATGGTAAAAQELCQKLGAQVVGFGFFLEIAFLEGRKKLSGSVNSVLIK